MAVKYSKWDIVYPLRYPESILCCSCGRHFTINPQQECDKCNTKNHVSNIIAKLRPMILWIDQKSWYKSMTFGIPLSTSGYFTDTHNQKIDINECTFFDKDFEKPMRAIICQATRADGNVLESKHLVGQISDSVLRTSIENKLFNWLFSI